MAAREVVVEHRDGRRYGVKATDPRATGDEAGWTVVAEADNTTPYVAPKKAERPAKADDKKAEG